MPISLRQNNGFLSCHWAEVFQFMCFSSIQTMQGHLPADKWHISVNHRRQADSTASVFGKAPIIPLFGPQWIAIVVCGIRSSGALKHLGNRLFREKPVVSFCQSWRQKLRNARCARVPDCSRRFQPRLTSLDVDRFPGVEV